MGKRGARRRKVRQVGMKACRRDKGAGEEGGGVKVNNFLRGVRDVAVRRAGAVSMG
jgi:hypothetical protein